MTFFLTDAKAEQCENQLIEHPWGICVKDEECHDLCVKLQVGINIVAKSYCDHSITSCRCIACLPPITFTPGGGI